MLWISKTRDGMDCVNFTRGDDAGLPITLKNGDEAYEMDPTEYLIFGVRAKPEETSPILLSLTSEPGSNIIVFAHNDTVDMDIGEYSADVQLMTAEGMRVTVWPKLPDNRRTSTQNWRNFAITPEVVRE